MYGAWSAQLEPLLGRPAGISSWQVASALRNWEEFGSMLDGISNVTLSFLNVGSGKSGNPCLRRHAAPMR